jgi:heme exporter protein C
MSSQPRALKILNIASILLVLGAFAMAMWYAPVEKVMGAVQKVFYFHVANAWVGMLGFLAAAVAGIIYLRSHDLKWDIVEVAAVEISLVFFFIAIILGSIWARPSWGTYWTWEPRLTTAAILELIYVAYLLLRQSLDDPDRRARFSAVYTLVGGVSVPITFLSIRFFRTIHPVVIGSGAGETMGMTPEMMATMFVGIAVFSIVFVTLFWHRIRLGQMASKIEQLKLKVMD